MTPALGLGVGVAPALLWRGRDAASGTVAA
jgi:hypothetical protein